MKLLKWAGLAGVGLMSVIAISVMAGPPQVGSTWNELSIEVAPGSSYPFPRGSFAAASATENGKSGWMFGGVVDDFTENPVYNNELFRIDPAGSKVRFTEIVANGASPSERAFPSLAVLRSGNEEDVYLFGGGTFPFNIPFPSGDAFWKYNTGTNTWTNLTSVNGPEPRLGATLVAHENAIYVFGGISFDFEVQFFTLHNDLWKYDVVAQSWTLLSNNAGPAARHVAMGAVIEDDKLLIYGGERIEVEFDPEFSLEFPIDTTTWVWDLEDGGWTQLADGPPQNYGAFGSNGESLIIFGGDAAGGVTCSGSPFNQNTTNNLFVFSEEYGWNFAAATNPPAPVKRTAGFALKNEFYTFGGFDFTCEDGQIWNTKVHRIKFKH